MFVGRYINLDHRADRREHFEKNILSVRDFGGIKRFSAIQDSNGPLGCTKSHIRALSECLNEYPSTPHYLIVEDDLAVIPERRQFIDQFFTSFRHIEGLPDWDIILFTPVKLRSTAAVQTSKAMSRQGFTRVRDRITTTGYIVKASFAPELLDVFRRSEQLLKMGLSSSVAALDITWLPLQHRHRFFAFHKNVFCQMPGYSDNERRFTNVMHQYM